jgi:hypothetical protein
MKDKDIKHLEWVYERMKWVHNEHENHDYMIRFREILEELRQADVSGSVLADEFHEWIELYDWQFNPVSFNGVIKYRWVNETYSGQATTKELYEMFLSQK